MERDHKIGTCMERERKLGGTAVELERSSSLTFGVVRRRGDAGGQACSLSSVDPSPDF